MHGTNAETAAGWDNARPSFARRCPGWIPPGAQTSAAPSGPAPPESPQACDSKLGPPPFSGPRIEANGSVGLHSAYRADPRPPANRPGGPKVDVVLALVAALLFALGTVLQQRAGLEAPSEGASSGLLLRMARRPVWLAGIAADGLGFVAPGGGAGDRPAGGGAAAAGRQRRLRAAAGRPVQRPADPPGRRRRRRPRRRRPGRLPADRRTLRRQRRRAARRVADRRRRLRG